MKSVLVDVLNSGLSCEVYVDRKKNESAKNVTNNLLKSIIQMNKNKARYVFII